MTKFFEKYGHLLSIVCPIVIGLIYLVLCMLNLNSSIWFDESYSSYLVRGDFAEIWSLTAIDVHPPFFYFCLKIWSLFFGHSVFAMRFMSVFFGLVAIVLAFQLVKKHFGVRPAILASLLMAVSPMFVRYGQEMRMYTLVICIVLGATYMLSLALEKQKRWCWIIYGVLVSLGMWTHYFSALMWIAHVIYILYDGGAFQKGGLKKFWQNKVLVRNVLWGYGLAVLLYLPWLPSFLRQANGVQQGFWIGDVSVNSIVDFVTMSLMFLSAGAVRSWQVVLVVATVAAIIYVLMRTSKNNRGRASGTKKSLGMFVCCGVLPPVLLVLLSLPPLKPIFMDRYVLYSMATIWLLVGAGISLYNMQTSTLKDGGWIKKYAAGTAAIVLILICFVHGIVNVTNREPSGYISYTFDKVRQLAEPGEPILARSDWNFYDLVAYTSEEHPVMFYEGWSEYQWGSLEPIRSYKYNVFSNFEEYTADKDSLWVLVNTDEDELPEEFVGYRIDGAVSDEHHVAYHLVRE